MAKHSRPKSPGIRTRLLCTYIVFIIIPFILVGVVACSASFKTIIRQTEQYSQALLSRINGEIDAFIEKIERLSYTVYTDKTLQDILSQTEEVSFAAAQNQKEYIVQKLIGMWAAEKYIIGSYACASDGRIFYTDINEQPALEGIEAFSQEEWFEDVMQGRRLSALTDVYCSSRYAEISEQNMVSYVHTIKSITTGAPLGFLVIDLSTVPFMRILETYDQTLGGQLTLYDAQGQSFFDISLYQETDAQESRQGFILHDDTSAKTGWVVRAQIPYRQFYKEIYQIAFITGAVGICCLLLFIFLSTWFANDITLPIRRLQQGMRHIDKGDFTVSIPVTREDEIGMLTHSFNAMAASLHTMIDQVYRTRLEKQQAEFAALQSQINPHFMYNTLETVNMMAIMAGAYDISDILSAFGKLLRANLNNRENIISLGREIEYIQHYLFIMRMGNQQKYAYEIEATPEARRCFVPKLTLQPIVENAILHGLEGMEKGGIIRVNAYVTGDILHLCVEDNGRGIEPGKQAEMMKTFHGMDKSAAGKSIGLSNVASRCRLFFGESFDIRFDAPARGQARGTIVHLMAKVTYQNEPNQEVNHAYIGYH